MFSARTHVVQRYAVNRSNVFCSVEPSLSSLTPCLGVTDTDNSREFHAAADPSPVAGRLHPAVGRLARGGPPAHHPRHD